MRLIQLMHLEFQINTKLVGKTVFANANGTAPQHYNMADDDTQADQSEVRQQRTQVINLWQNILNNE